MKTKNLKAKQTSAYDQYLAANPEMTDFVKGSGIMPENATREEQDVARIYQSAYANERAINQRADNAIFDANKARDLSEKYLAVQNEANGLGGLGIADTSSLRLSSQYQKAIADTNATRENALQDNYSKMQEDVQTVRGEWASKVGDTIMGSDDRIAVDRYLAANGIVEGTEEYDRYISQWELAYPDTLWYATGTYDDNGNPVFRSSRGETQSVGQGINPYTLTKHADAKYGTFSNGYQPNNIGGTPLTEAKKDGVVLTTNITGKNQTIWEANGKYWLWRGDLNKYIEVDISALDYKRKVI